MRTNRRRTILFTASALVAGLLLTACGSSSDSNSAGSSAAGVADKAAAPERALAGTAQDALGQNTPAQAPNLSVDQRSIVYRGSMSVRVKDVTAAASQTTGIAGTAGGFVGADNRTRGGGDDVATMELRVPGDKFAAVVDQLAKTLGTEESRQISTEDVTEQSVDLDARITVQQARVDTGRKLLAQAKSLSDLVMLEREVATREADLASLQAKKRHLADLVALSTITVTLLGPHAAAPASPNRPGGFLGGLAAGWHALLASLAVLLTVLGAVLPWLIGLGLPVWLIVLLARRVTRGRRPVPAPAMASSAAGPPPAGEPAEQPADS